MDEVVSSGAAHYDSFTSRGQIGSKIRKSRQWNVRARQVLCRYCRTDCYNELDLSRHIAKKHKGATEAA